MENFKAMLRMRLSLEESDQHLTYYFLSGSVFSNIPGEPLQRLFRFNGMNKAKCIKKENDKFMFNSKEFVIFEDPKSGEVLNIWDNPFTGEQNEVFHTYNDPVNIPLFPAFIPPPTKLYGDKLTVFPQTIPLRYPNPITPEAYPGYSTGNFYVASESFVSSSWTKDAYDDAQLSVPAMIFWTRTCPWLPWMKMGTRPGGLLYTSQSWKLSNVQDIPSQLNQRITAMFPEFLPQVPRPLSEQNQSSWTVFKAEIDRRREAGMPDQDLEKVTKDGNKPGDRFRPLADNAKSLELIRNKTYTFSLTGKATVVGSPERRFPWGLQGTSTVTTTIYADDIRFSILYELTVIDPKTSAPLVSIRDPATSEEIKVLPISVTQELILSKEDIGSTYHNGLRTLSFACKDATLSAASQVSLAFREDSSEQGEVSFFSATAMPLINWMESVTSGEYCVLNMCG